MVNGFSLYTFCDRIVTYNEVIDMIIDLITDAAIDSLRLFPFLFLAFFILELLEKYSGHLNQTMLVRFRKAGPLLGGLLGCIPECGIPVLGANLFASSLISPGTLLAVFLSSSDEAILILLGMPEKSDIIPALLICKGIIAIVCGYLVDFFFAKHFETAEDANPLEHHTGCCHHHHNIFVHALQHTFNLFFYIFIFNLALNLLLNLIGFTKLASLLLKNSIFQPILTAVIGLIPNCAASILLTQLFGEGILSFASLVSGLCASTGLGLFVLFKTCQDKKRLFKILGTLWGCSASAGIILSILF